VPCYAALLGHQPAISLAELAACIEDLRIHRNVGKHVVLFESARELDGACFDRLGGVVLLAREVNDAPPSLEEVPKLLAKEVSRVKGKVTFSLRPYDVPRKAVHDLYRACKAHFRKLGKPSRYVGTEREPAPAVLLRKAGMLSGEHGCELFLVQEESRVWCGRTIGAQDVDAYTKRDMEKPVRDTRTGLLPPKLAQILLNFASWLARQHSKLKTESSKLTIYDPFCGSGVIPMECLRRLWPVLASDVSLRAVHATERNLEWLRKEEKILKKDVSSTVWKQDATKAFVLPRGLAPDVIVTETSLGPPLTTPSPIREAHELRRESEELESGFLRAVAAALPHTPIVCTWPVWMTSKGEIFLELVWDVLHESGYHATLPPGIEPSTKKRLSLIYRRPNQFVGREIVLLQRRR